MKSRYGVRNVAENRKVYDKKYYRANREKILAQHAQRYDRMKTAIDPLDFDGHEPVVTFRGDLRPS